MSPVQLIALMAVAISGCHSAERDLQNSERGFTCIAAEYGNPTRFCYVPFNEAIRLASINYGTQVEIKGVLSLEFNQCVLHRDDFGASALLDAESLWVKEPSCTDEARSLLGGKRTTLVRVRGNLEAPRQESIRRSGSVVDVTVLEQDIEPTR